MQTLEFILIFSTLLGVLALFMSVIDDHRLASENAQKILLEKWSALRCSSLADAAVNHFGLVPSRGCLHFPYALNPPHSPFLLVLGGDSNHYG